MCSIGRYAVLFILFLASVARQELRKLKLSIYPASARTTPSSGN